MYSKCRRMNNFFNYRVRGHKGEKGVCQTRTFADVRRRGGGGMRTSAKFWGFFTKFDINLDKNC